MIMGMNNARPVEPFRLVVTLASVIWSSFGHAMITWASNAADSGHRLSQ